MANKKSIWSTIILIATVVSLILLVIALVVLIVGVPATRELVKQAAIEGGFSEEEAAAIGLIATITLIVAFVITSIFDILKIIGGFLFSLKGKWGLFCIVVSILGAIGAVFSLFANIRNKGAVGSIVVDVITLAVDVLLVVACFKHKAEIA